MLQVESVMLVLMLIAAVRARDELIGSHALAWPLLLGTLLMLAGSAYLWLTYEHHPVPPPARVAWTSSAGGAVLSSHAV